MLYMPTTTLSTPVGAQQIQAVPLISTIPYYTLPPTTVIPAVSYVNTSLVYPKYALATKPIETNIIAKSQIEEVTKPVQHVIHHHIPSCSECCSRRKPSPESRARTPTPPPPLSHDRQRYSRRDDFDRTQVETIDEKIERIRDELKLNSSSKRDQSTETIDYYHPPLITQQQQQAPLRIPYKQHYDPPRRPRSRTASSSRKVSSLPREPWRSTNQNDYLWRDAHLPAYRQATLSRSQTPVSESCRVNKPFSSSLYSSQNNNIYRPKSEIEARKYYIQSTGKNPDCEVYQTLPEGTSYSTNQQYHSFYSDLPTKRTLKTIDMTPKHDFYRSDDSCLHIMPKNGCSLDPPYLKILNAPVTYLH